MSIEMVAVAVPSQLAVRRRAMLTPGIDVACLGGLSIVVCGALYFFCPVPFDKHVPMALPYLLTLGITWPHFLSSYRLLYASRTSAFAHPVASLYFPAALLLYALFAVAYAQTSSVPLDLFALAAGVYLARHYTGQTWGMMASFAHVSGVAFAPRERKLAVFSLNLVMAWHVTWALEGVDRLFPALGPVLAPIDRHIDAVGVFAFLLGLGALGSMAFRTRAFPPVRIVVPYLALYAWYALLRRDPTSLVIIQASHALQYLPFPLRIEETRRVSAQGGLARLKTDITLRRASLWLAVLILLSLATFAGLPGLFRISYGQAGGAGALSAAFLSAFVSFVNIHHYFIDGCLYKLRNPEVRRDLFAHLKQPDGPEPASAGAAPS